MLSTNKISIEIRQVFHDMWGDLMSLPEDHSLSEDDWLHTNKLGYAIYIRHASGPKPLEHLIDIDNYEQALLARRAFIRVMALATGEEGEIDG